jgi:predicted RND superfamily exporter protein
LEEARRSKEPLYRLGANLIKYRLPITVVISLFTAFMAYQSFQIKMTTAFNDLLPYRHPFVQGHLKFADQFGGANNVNVMLKVGKGDVFTKQVLKKIFDMTQAMDRVSGVNHDQIASIGHRTTRYLTVLGGTIMAPADFRMAGGLIGVTGAANEEILKNDILMNVLGFGTIFIIIMFTYRSAVAALVMMVAMFLANGVVNAYMRYRNIGINLQSLPIVTVGLGFGIDYGVYLVSRAVEGYRGDVTEAMRIGIATAGKAVTFTAFTLSLGAACWMFSSIRFCSEMGLLLALWMMISVLGSCTLVPALIVLMKPKFFLRAVEEGIVG